MALDPRGTPEELQQQVDRDADAMAADVRRKMAGMGETNATNAGRLAGDYSRAKGGADLQSIMGANYGGSLGASQAELSRLGGIAGQYQNGAMDSWQQGQGSRLSQQDALGLMQQAAYGNAPSVAAQQQQQGIDAAIRSQQAMAAGARGPGGLAAAQYNAAINSGALQQGSVGQAAILRAQEMATARGMYGQMATGIRGQDIGSAMGQGQMGLGYEGLGQNINMANMHGQQTAAALAQQRWAQQAQMDQAADAARMSNITGILGAGAGLIAAIPTGGASLGALAAAKGGGRGLGPAGGGQSGPGGLVPIPDGAGDQFRSASGDPRNY